MRESKQHDEYDLKMTNILDIAKFRRFVHTNRPKLESIIRRCWSEDQVIDLLRVGKRLVVADPESEPIKLIKRNTLLSSCSCDVIPNLESNHGGADKLIFLYVHTVQVYDQDQKPFIGVVFQSNDTDVTLLSIAHYRIINLQSYYIKKVNNYSRAITFINVKIIGKFLEGK